VKSLLFVAGALALAAVGWAQEWPQWRGPNRDGHAPFTAPKSWPAELKQAWSISVGIGHSSPVVSGNRVFVLSRQEEREVVAAYDVATGKAVWQDGHPVPYTMNAAATMHGKGPKSTPVVHAGLVYTLGISGTLSAHDAATGRLRWRKTFGDRFPMTAPLYGTAMSPVVDRGLLFVQVGGQDRGALIAFDAASGEEKWRWAGDGPAYASPVVAEFGAVRQVVTLTQNALVGVEAATGRLLWRENFTTDFDQNSVTPIVDGDRLIVSGLSRGVHALAPSRSVDRWSIAKVWANPDVSFYMSTPVLSGRLLFGLSHRNRGQFVCLDAATGKTLWTSEPRQADNASLIAAGDLLLATTTAGELIVLRRTPKLFDPIERYAIATSPVWAHPALLPAALLVKAESTLARWNIS
jgi:outer membrane protein assembly factor BamB